MKTIDLAKINFGGGGGAPVPPVPPGPTPVVTAKDVNMRDYDGTIIASYTAVEFAALTELPTPPEHEGLTFQGWNWTLVDAQACCAQYGTVEIGAIYITSDGKTRIYITLMAGRTRPALGLGINGSVDVDWGDGSAHDTMTGSSLSTVADKRHTYSQPGDYVITIEVLENSEIAFLGNNSGSYILFDGSINSILGYNNAVKSIVTGQGVTSIGNNAFANCYSLTSINIPQSVTAIGGNAFDYCCSLTSINIPQGVTAIGDYAFRSCSALKSISIPQGVTPNIYLYAFAYCYGLTSINIPQGVISIASNAFDYCYSLTSINIPQGVTAIGNNAFRGCSSLAVFKILATTPPTIQGTTISSIPSDCIIYVPAESVQAYKTATNWSGHASKIQPIS